MSKPLTHEELKRLRREDHRSPITLRLLATVADLEHQLAEAQGKLEAMVAEMLRRADCSDYEHKLYVPGRACSCGLDETLDRILSKEDE